MPAEADNYIANFPNIWYDSKLSNTIYREGGGAFDGKTG